MRKTKVILFITSVFLSCAPASGFEVAREGKAACSIVLSPMASPSEKLAAEELAAYVKKISGAELPVRTEITPNRLHHQPCRRHDYKFHWDVEPDSRHTQSWSRLSREDGEDEPPEALRGIVIGTVSSLTPIPRSVRRKLEESENEEAFYIRSEGENIYVIGKEPVGALYGTYTLLEEYMGVRWFHPGELGEHYPKTETLVLQEINDFQKPAMATRMRRGGAGPYHAYEANIWGARNKMQIMSNPALRWFEPGRSTPERAEFINSALNARASRGGHVTFELAVPAELIETNPGYFTLRDGERRVGDRLQRCVSNSDVLKLVAEYALDWVNADPGNIFTLDGHDRLNNWCECDDCVEMGTVDGQFKATNLFHRFFSGVADYVLEQNPEARLNVMFYTDSMIPPDDRSIRYEGKNVRGVYCTAWPYRRCYAHALSDSGCRANREVMENLKTVLEICPRIYTYEYLCNSNVEYVPVWKTKALDIKHLAEIGVEGYMDIVHAHKWRPRWLSLYIGAKLHWDTGLDEDELREEAYRKYYGAAAPAMTEYHDLRMRLWDNAPGHVTYGGPRRQAYCLTVPGAEEELKALLGRAKELAAGDELVLTRIGLDERFLEEYWIKPAWELKALFSKQRSLLPEKATEEITIDAELSEDPWLRARPAGEFISLRSRNSPVESTDVRVLYDRRNLYFGVVAMAEHTWGEQLKAYAMERDDIVWKDDSFEILIATPDSEEEGVYYRIISNTMGVVYDARNRLGEFHAPFDSGVEVKVAEKPGRHIYEFKIPLEPLGAEIVPGQSWGMHFVRNCRSLQPPDTSEISTLDGIEAPEVLNFRRVVFGDDAVRNGNFAGLEPADEANRERGVVGDAWINKWGVRAGECEIIEGTRNTVRLKNGSIFQYLRLPPESAERDRTISFEIRARGEGAVAARLSTSIIPPLSGLRFGHHRQTRFGPFDLGREPAYYRFRHDLAPHEVGYIYVSASGGSEVFIDHISAVVE